MTASFVDLDRRFTKPPDARHPEESAEESYLFGRSSIEDGVGWSKVLNHRLALILGEPGSGKTTEFRHQAEGLWGESGNGFFVRLDRLVLEPWPEVLGEVGYASFIKWKQAHHHGWFFLDSVDEAKIRRSNDFFTALQKTSEAIGVEARAFARIVLSSRISEWRPITDLEEFRRLFALADSSPMVASAARDKTYGAGDDTRASFTVKRRERATIGQEGPVVYCIAPLDPERVTRFARSRDLPDSEAFICALTAEHAWELAHRPVDVDGLIEYWRQHGRLGTLSQLIEHNVARGLREVEDREAADPLSPQVARQGAETLAAAAILCRNLNFRVPDDASISASQALDASAFLALSWTPLQRRALLSRGLFDGATYGCIRFHHRRITEYLAASWLNRRIADGCPLDRLEGLLFARHRGEIVVRPALAPVVAWLANGNEPHHRVVRERILQSEPGIHFKYGDPAELPTAYKRQVLLALAQRYDNRQRAWYEHDAQALARLADPALAPDVTTLIRNQSLAVSLRADMLLLVRHGRMISCLAAALDIIADPAETDDLKECAVAAIRESEHTPSLTRLGALIRGLSSFGSRLAGIAIETLYPTIIDDNDLVTILQRSERPRRYSVDLQWVLKKHLKKCVDADRAGGLLDRLLGLLTTGPCIDSGADEEQLSAEFEWLCDVLPPVVEILLKKETLSQAEARTAAQAVRVLTTYWTHRGHRDERDTGGLSAGIGRHPELKRQYFWRGVKAYRRVSGEDPRWAMQALQYQHTVCLDSSDLSWLAEDAQGLEAEADRRLALRVAFEVWQPYREHWPRAVVLLPLARKAGMASLFWGCLWQSMTLPARALWSQHIGRKFLDRHWWRQRQRAMGGGWQWLKDQYILHRRLRWLYQAKAVSWLGDLSREADSESSRWAVSDWAQLRRRRGPFIAWAVRRGCEAYWRRYIPSLPHEKPDPNQTTVATIVGLCGLQSSWQGRRLAWATLSREEANHAARYALCELNGFSDWLPELARVQPDAVRDALRICIQGEWLLPNTREHVDEVLAKLVWNGEEYWNLIIGDLLGQADSGDPGHPQILYYALSILLKALPAPHSRLKAIAETRAPHYPTGSPFFMIWMALWLELAALDALTFLQARINSVTPSEADKLVLSLCDALRADRAHSRVRVANPDYLNPSAMRVFVPLVYRHVRSSEDIEHGDGAAYWVGEREEAQEFREGLIQRLSQLESNEVPTVLEDLSACPELCARRDWILHLRDDHVRRTLDLPPLTAADVRAWEAEYETGPRNDAELFQIACCRLNDIRREVELAENSLRDEVQNTWDEAALRRWLQRKLIDRARDRYTIPQEAETDLAQRADLRFEHPGIAAVPVEVKWAEEWSSNQLLERLENQLVGQYLRAHNVWRGVYVVALMQKRKWKHPSEASRFIEFEELLSVLRVRAQELERYQPGVAEIAVIAIDFTTR